MRAAESASFFGRLEAFVGALRRAGIAISIGEHLDSLSAVDAVGIAGRETLRCALGATLVKDQWARPVFDALFDVYFPLAAPQEPAASGQSSAPGEAGRGEAATSTRDSPLDKATPGAEIDLAGLAARLVDRHAGFNSQRPVGVSYYLYRTMRAARLAGALDEMVAAEQQTEGGDPAAIVNLRRLRGEQRSTALEAAVESELIRRMVAARGPDQVAAQLRRQLPKDVDLSHASWAQLAELRSVLVPLSTRLASRLARKRHRHRGGLDVRATLRRSLAYGGVAIDPRFRSRRAVKPELWVLADVSGSVSGFARFTLQLLYALSSQFAKTRAFVFVDLVDEVSQILAAGMPFEDVIGAVGADAKVVGPAGHSDYGAVFEAFRHRFGSELGRRSTVVVLGDARGNYHPARPDALEAISTAARRVFWLNPEPASNWDSGDSLVSAYAPYCDGVFDCRNLRQLEAFVDRLA